MADLDSLIELDLVSTILLSNTLLVTVMEDFLDVKVSDTPKADFFEDKLTSVSDLLTIGWLSSISGSLSVPSSKPPEISKAIGDLSDISEWREVTAERDNLVTDESARKYILLTTLSKSANRE